MGLAVRVERGGLRIVAESNRPVLMGGTRDRYLLSEIQGGGNQSVLHPYIIKHILQLGHQALVSFSVVFLVSKRYLSILVYRHAVIWVG